MARSLSHSLRSASQADARRLDAPTALQLHPSAASVARGGVL